MPIGVGAAMLIGSAVAGGASVVGGKMASNSAKNAAKTQTASVDKAQQFNEKAWQQQQAALAPYQQAGQSALGSLMTRFGGKPLENSYAPPGQFARPPQGAGPLTAAMGSPQGPPAAPGQPAASGGQPPGAPMPPGAPSEPMVLMAGPDGSQKQIPQSRVPDAMARGARRVA